LTNYFAHFTDNSFTHLCEYKAAYQWKKSYDIMKICYPDTVNEMWKSLMNGQPIATSEIFHLEECSKCVARMVMSETGDES
jgi:hypothetical protein